MNLMALLGFKKKDGANDTRPAQPAPSQKADPHKHGGCCGSCGGQDRK